MTYVVTEACIKCKFMDCVEVCPVDCFYEGENMLVINPDECIDCGVCEPECPPEAIKADTESGLEKWLSVNAEYAKVLAQYHPEGRGPGRRQGDAGRAGQVREVLRSASPARAPDAYRQRTPYCVCIQNNCHKRLNLRRFSPQRAIKLRYFKGMA